MLTEKDLDRAVEECGGYGYSVTRREHNPRVCVELDKVVLRQANALGLSYEELAAWVDSKLGRWLSDSLGVQWPAEEVVERFLNRESVDTLMELGVSNPLRRYV